MIMALFSCKRRCCADWIILPTPKPKFNTGLKRAVVKYTTLYVTLYIHF